MTKLLINIPVLLLVIVLFVLAQRAGRSMWNDWSLRRALKRALAQNKFRDEAAFSRRGKL